LSVDDLTDNFKFVKRKDVTENRGDEERVFSSRRERVRSRREE